MAKCPFGLGLKQRCIPTLFKDYKKAEIMTSRLETKNIFRISTTMLAYLHNRNAFLVLMMYLMQLSFFSHKCLSLSPDWNLDSAQISKKCLLSLTLVFSF